MRTLPKVTVALTTWNRPGWCEVAIESVLNQTYQDFELLILDDNSTDPVQLKLLDHYAKHPKVTVARSKVTAADRMKKVRYAVLANVGLRMAKGEYLSYLCDDDYYFPERLEKMVARLDVGDDAKIVYGSQRLFNQGMETGVRRAELVLDDAYCKVDHSSVMHVTQVGRDVGGWDTDAQWWMLADAIFWRRLNRAGYKFYPVSDVTDAHRFHATSVQSILSAGRPLA